MFPTVNFTQECAMVKCAPPLKLISTLERNDVYEEKLEDINKITYFCCHKTDLDDHSICHL